MFLRYVATGGKMFPLCPAFLPVRSTSPLLARNLQEQDCVCCCRFVTRTYLVVGSTSRNRPGLFRIMGFQRWKEGPTRHLVNPFTCW